METKTCFFEDDLLANFHPLTLTRPLYDLRIGILTLGEKWNHSLNLPENKPAGILREPFKALFSDPDPDEDQILWINPRFLPNSHLKDTVKNLDIKHSLTCNGEPVAAHINREIHKNWLMSGINIDNTITEELNPDDIQQIRNVWDLFLFNGAEINADLGRITNRTALRQEDYPRCGFVKSEHIFAEDGVIIEPGAVLIAENGPVYLGKNAVIMANSVLRGPVAVCDNSTVKAGSKIYEDTTIGPVCKVAGEISNSVFHSYCNKAHDGFVGNSVFGQWCNLGADTNTSNLKNNYSTIRLTEWESGEEIETEQQFIGTIMGDHSKTGINAMLNTGTVCGVSCNIFSGGYAPKFIRSFKWVSDERVQPYRTDKAIETMRRVMARRDVEMTPEYEKMMRTLAKD